MNAPRPTITIVGMPLDEAALPHLSGAHAMEEAQVIIAESPAVALPMLKRARINTSEKEIFFLDPPDRNPPWKDCLLRMIHRGGKVVLFSDVGMPVLFDPGTEILEFCLKHEFEIRTVPGPTAWGTACALSGFGPPFYIVGFLPREQKNRAKVLYSLRSLRAHGVLMDTPYRFRALLDQLIKALGENRVAFLAWEIGKSNELYFWGSLREMEVTTEKRALQKGEFVLILKATR